MKPSVHSWKRRASSNFITVAVAIMVLIVAGLVVYPQITKPENVNPNTDPDPNTKPNTTPTPTVETVTDVEGNVYKTVKIGNQTWMAENLKTTKYNDGQEIPQVTGNSAWGSLTTPGYCWLNNDVTNKDAYGALYNWYVVETGMLAPKGWHVPTEEDWSQLSNYLGGDSVAGGKMKEGGTSHWFSPNLGATNESGFTAIPSSTRNYDGLIFYRLGDGAYFWSSTEYDDSTAWVRSMLCDSTALKSFNSYKSYGRSVRCVKDSPRLEPAVDTVTDVDGNIYKTIKIGNQTWMAENLRTTKYNDGEDIPLVTNGYDWSLLTTPGYCWYNNDPVNGETYGALYNWYAVNSSKLAPPGWHVPSEEDWEALTAYLGGDLVAGGKLKEKGIVHWRSPNVGATDEFGFSAFPCSTRGILHGDHFYGLSDSCYFWSVGEFSSTEAWFRYMNCDSTALKSWHDLKTYGRPVRLIKDG